jgi:hypothetical protein
LGLELKYIYILEIGEENNRVHAHLVMNHGLSREELTALWGLGSVSVDKLRFENDGLTALAVYLTKTEVEDRLTWKRWVGSRNLAKPIVTERDGRISHKTMSGFCQDGGDCNYLETQYIGYEAVEYSIYLTEDTYGGFYLSALLKKFVPNKKDLLLSASLKQSLFNF